MEIFNILNIFFLCFAFFFSLASMRRPNLFDVCFSAYVLIASFITSTFSSILSVFNILVLMLSIYILTRSNAPLNNNSSGGIYKLRVFPLLFVLVFLTFYVDKSIGIFLFVSLAIIYWALCLTIILYSIEWRSDDRIWYAILIFVTGFAWEFKLAIFISIVMLVNYLFYQISIKHAISAGVLLSLLAVIVMFAEPAKIMMFLEKSVFRPEFSDDTKILGFSDGMRLSIWDHYIDNSVFFGKGYYYLPEVVPTHNIIVHLIHEFGWIGFFLLMPAFVFLTIRLYRNVNFVFFIFMIATLNLSSVGEYAVIWVPCFLILPFLITSYLFRRRLTRVIIKRSSVKNGSSL